MSSDAKTRSDTAKIAGQIEKQLKEKGQPFLGGQRPSREDVVSFQRLFGGTENTSLVRWSKHMAGIRPEDRKAFAGPVATPVTVASAPAAVKGQKAGYSSVAEKPQGKAAAAKKEGESQPSARRDFLIELELKAQKRWEETKAFEINPPAEGEEDTGKFMATFPYPYMNGKLHFGHAFSMTKAEFAVSFHRSLGKRSIFPFGFHCTGMPIQAAANKLKKEYSIYGSPYPTFPSGRPHQHPSAEGKAGSVKLVWAPPTSTGKDRTVKGYVVESRSTGGDWAKAAEASADVSDVSYDGAMKKRASVEVSGLEAKTGYEFRVIPTLSDGTAGPASAASDSIEAATGEKAKKGKGGPVVKAKIAAKSGDALHQWDILRAMGLDVEEIPAFQDPLKWLNHFPPEGAADLKRFGTHIDFRRTFITTSENQYYDKFVRWQFRKLKEGDKIAFGKRPTVYSETDKQACMDHDRSEGEGVGPQEYTGIKMKVLDPRPAVLADIPADKNIFLVAATLRPETMCGQTNCWILPEGNYGCFDVGNKDGDVFVCSARAARNMSFQDLFADWGKMTCLKEVTGKDLLGCAVHAPTSQYERVYVLPLLTIKMDKGTGVVTSVPADSPDDYAAFMELKNPGKRAHFGVKDEWIEDYDLVPIIDCEIDDEIRTHSAKYMCEKLGVKSQKDTLLLQEAHDVVYKAGFYKGVMSAGPYKGEKVQDAKDKTQKRLKESGDAIVYHEPAGLIVGRSGDECVIALIDQWYLKYGEDTWRKTIENHIQSDKFDTYTPAAKSAFLQATGWLREWACSRSFGLGTKIPWDEQFLIESLSDSTIYMAYYAIAKYLQGPDNFDGKKVGPAGIKPEQLNDDVFNYIFLKGPLPKDCTIPESQLAEMRREFEYWYPMDLRVSGKDLIQNHLTFCLYNHTAIWKDFPEMWPKSFFTNGWVLVNGEKMSKSKGNFFTLREACNRFSADALRLTCAGAGDGLEDPNFEVKNAEAAILRLTGFIEWSKRTIANVKAGEKKAERQLFVDVWFRNEMRRLIHAARGHFERMIYREASICGWFDFLSARDVYIDACPTEPAPELLLEWIENQTILISIICPHVGEHVWELLGKEGSILDARFPSPPPADNKILEQGRYLFRTVKEDLISKKEKALKKQPGLKTAKVFVAVKYPEWKVSVLDTLSQDWTENGNAFSKTVMKKFDPKALPEGSVLKAKGKNVGIFAAFVMQDAKQRGAAAFSKELPFDETALLKENKDWLLGKARLENIEFLPSDSAEASVQEQAAPGHPVIQFE